MATQTETDECFAGTDSRGRFTVIDLVSGERGFWGGKTLDETRAEYPDAERMALDVAARRSDEQYIHPVQEITRERFWYFLEVLPPCRWKHGDGWQTFFMSEFTSGNITQHCAQIGHDGEGARYFAKEDRASLQPADLVAACREFIAAHPEPTVTEAQS